MNVKRFFVLGVLGLFFVVFAAGVVSAAESSAGNTISTFFTNTFTQWQEGEKVDTSLAKILLWALISMVVYSVANNVPGLSGLFGKGKEWLGMVFSVVVGFLSMAYITPDEVYALMLSYSAMGFTISAIIPLLILSAFTFTLATQKAASAHQAVVNRLFAKAMWFMFAFFIGYKVLVGTFVEESGNITALGWIIFGVVTIIAFRINSIFRFAKKEELEVQNERLKRKVENSSRMIDVLNTQVETLSK